MKPQRTKTATQKALAKAQRERLAWRYKMNRTERIAKLLQEALEQAVRRQAHNTALGFGDEPDSRIIREAQHLDLMVGARVLPLTAADLVR